MADLATPSRFERLLRAVPTILAIVISVATTALDARAQSDKATRLDVPGVKGKGKTLTTDTGRPVATDSSSMTAGANGPTLLQDFYLIEKLARFDRERIPERVVHARGVGLHGQFICYENLSAVTKAAFLSSKGKATPVFARLSTVVLPKGSAEAARDVRGFAVKFYTEEGNYDLVGNDIPVFFIRDAIKFPDLVHALKPSPVSNVQEPNRFFDFFAASPESTHMMTFLFSDQGTPASVREMDGHGVHAFKWVNAKGQVHYLKYHWKSMQGIRNLTNDEAQALAGKEPASHTKEVYAAIDAGKFPSWELRVQLVKAEDMNKFDFDPLDATKDWPIAVVPETPVGKMTLTRYPDNFFQETEQVAFNTGAYVPGIEPSEDRLLQGRNFSYSDTQRHRLGPNYQQLPINQTRGVVRNINQDGLDNHGHTKGDINYQPSIRGASDSAQSDPSDKAPRTPLQGTVQQEPVKASDDFKQAGDRIRAMSATDRDHLLNNLAGEFKKGVNKEVLVRFVSNLYQADADFGQRLAEAAGVEIEQVKKVASRK